MWFTAETRRTRRIDGPRIRSHLLIFAPFATSRWPVFVTAKTRRARRTRGAKKLVRKRETARHQRRNAKRRSADFSRFNSNLRNLRICCFDLSLRLRAFAVNWPPKALSRAIEHDPITHVPVVAEDLFACPSAVKLAPEPSDVRLIAIDDIMEHADLRVPADLFPVGPD